MRVVIFGSREYAHPLMVRTRVRKLPAGTIVVVGGAPGVDSVAQHTAEQEGLAVDLHAALWETHGRKAGHVRNDEMLATDPELAIGFWNGTSPGTRSMIAKTEQRGIPLELWGPDGDLIHGGNSSLRLVKGDS